MALCLYGVEEIVGVDQRRPAHVDYVAVDAGASGTGGYEMLGPQSYFDPKLHRPVLYGDHLEAFSQSASPPSEQLKSIREKLKLNVSDLASVLGVSRPTIYAWLDGDEPSPENYTQLARLKDISDEVDRLAIPRFEKLLKRPVFHGVSFFDLLKTLEDPVEHLSLLKELAEKEHAARAAPKGSGRSIDNDGFLEQSTPIYESD